VEAKLFRKAFVKDGDTHVWNGASSCGLRVRTALNFWECNVIREITRACVTLIDMGKRSAGQKFVLDSGMRSGFRIS
jgi:hypothetical protein